MTNLKFLGWGVLYTKRCGFASEAFFLFVLMSSGLACTLESSSSARLSMSDIQSVGEEDLPDAVIGALSESGDFESSGSEDVVDLLDTCECNGTVIDTICVYQWVSATGNCSDSNSPSAHFFVHGMFVENRSNFSDLDISCTLPNAYFQNEYTHLQMKQVIPFGCGSGWYANYHNTIVRAYSDRVGYLDDYDLEENCNLAYIDPYSNALRNCTLDISISANYYFTHATAFLPREDTGGTDYAHLQGFLICYDPDA